MKPLLEIDQSALLHNLKTLQALTRENGISMSLVTKGLVGYEPLVRLLVENGADSICEAHIENLVKYHAIPAEKWLIRSPLLSEAEDVVRYADVSLVSEIVVLEHLSEAAVKQGRPHKAVVMLELGELREGCMPDELLQLCETCLTLPGIELHGIGANLSCISEVVPDSGNMAVLASAAAKVELALGMKLKVVSGGSSSSLKMLAEKRLPAAINHLRIGEGVLLGNVVCYDVPFEGARTDAFTLNAEIIEVKDKPSLPWGERAPGILPIREDPALKDIGIRRRALIAIGKQDIPSKYLVPLDDAVKIIGDTSDCLVADITDCGAGYKTGDAISFSLKYNGLVSAMASQYIEKKLV